MCKWPKINGQMPGGVITHPETSGVISPLLITSYNYFVGAYLAMVFAIIYPTVGVDFTMVFGSFFLQRKLAWRIIPVSIST